jgi:hypothetical protein
MDFPFHTCALKRYACLRVAAPAYAKPPASAGVGRSAEAGRASTGMTKSGDPLNILHYTKYSLSLIYLSYSSL